jgi:uncharacterized protein
MIWDVHTHLHGVDGRTPEEKMAQLVRFADRMGVERMVLMMGYPFIVDPTTDQLRQQNDQALKALDHYHDRAFGFVYRSGKHPDYSLKELERCVKNGPMVGIKLWVARRCDTEEIDPIIKRSIELKAPILQHTWLKTQGNLPGESTPLDLANLAKRHPNASFICGHSGGDWQLGLRTIRELNNVVTELGGSDPTTGFVEMAVRELGAERVVFGSDAGGRTIGQWPFRRHGYEETAALAKKLKNGGVTEAWVSSFEGLLHKDLARVNIRLAAECKTVSEVKLIPFGSINPKWPNWNDDLKRCHEEHGMPGVRLHPNYHGYKLEDAICVSLFEACAKRKLVVQIAVKMEDDRTQHPLMQLAAVDLKPLPELLGKFPDLRVVILNSAIDPRTEALVPLARAGRVYFDFAMLEGVGSVGRLVERVGLERVLFGSHFPLFHLESAVLKMKEADLNEQAAKAILEKNARTLLA